MEILVHVFLFLFPAGVIWFFAGILIEAVDRVARRFHKTDFSVAFFLLGFLTSLSEISVALNSLVFKEPHVSAGNLVGASFVIILFIIPLLAALSRGIELRHTLSTRNIQLALVTIILPALFLIDGNVTRSEGLLALLVYITLVFAIRRQKQSAADAPILRGGPLDPRTASAADIIKIIIGGICIFIAGYYLVEQAVYFANLLHTPSSLIGLTILSLGTNVPEFIIAARSILARHKDIALGDYIGSAAANTPIFALLALLGGPFSLSASGFVSTSALMVGGCIVFYYFARSRRIISKQEGWILLSFYAAFLAVQIFNFMQFATD